MGLFRAGTLARGFPLKYDGDVSRRQEAGGPTISRLWIVVAVVVAILILGDLNRRMGDARRLERDAAGLQAEVAGLEAENELLATRVAAATSELIVEEWARSEARLVREGEHLIVPLPASGSAAAPTPEAQASLPELSPWDVWKIVLFGKP